MDGINSLDLVIFIGEIMEFVLGRIDIKSVLTAKFWTQCFPDLGSGIISYPWNVLFVLKIPQLWSVPH